MQEDGRLRTVPNASLHAMAQKTKDTRNTAVSQPLCAAPENWWHWRGSRIHRTLAGMGHPSFGGWRTSVRPRVAWRLPLLLASRIIAASGPRSWRSGMASEPIFAVRKASMPRRHLGQFS
jgi:hypothetical protein